MGFVTNLGSISLVFSDTSEGAPPKTRAIELLVLKNMKPKTRIVLLFMALILPYMAFVLYFALQLPQHPLPKWFPYVAACYFFGSILSFPFLRKRVLANAPPVSVDVQKVQNVKAARAARRMGYLWLIGSVFYVLSGQVLREPWWVSIVGLSWVGFLSWASFRIAKNIEMKAHHDGLT